MAHTWSQPFGGRVNFFVRARDSGPSKEETAVGRFLKRVFKLGVLAGAGYAAWRWYQAQRTESDLSWEAQPAPYPPQPRPQGSGPGASPVSKPAPEASPAEPSGA